MYGEFKAIVWFIKEINYSPVEDLYDGLKSGYYRTESDAVSALEKWIAKTGYDVFQYRICHCIDAVTLADLVAA